MLRPDGRAVELEPAAALEDAVDDGLGKILVVEHTRAGYFLHPHGPGCVTPPFGSRDAGH